MLSRDEETILRYWHMLEGAPCVPPEEIGDPKCRDGEPAGTPVRAGVFRCGAPDRPTVRLEDISPGVPDDWELYSVRIDETRGRNYEIIFTPEGRGDVPGVQLLVRTSKPDLPPFDPPVAFYSYGEPCDAADTQIQTDNLGCAGASCVRLIPPPEER